MNLRNIVILLYVFRMSANKLSYETFTKELQKNYDVYNYLFVNTFSKWRK